MIDGRRQARRNDMNWWTHALQTVLVTHSTWNESQLTSGGTPEEDIIYKTQKNWWLIIPAYCPLPYFLRTPVENLPHKQERAFNTVRNNFSRPIHVLCSARHLSALIYLSPRAWNVDSNLPPWLGIGECRQMEIYFFECPQLCANTATR